LGKLPHPLLIPLSVYGEGVRRRGYKNSLNPSLRKRETRKGAGYWLTPVWFWGNEILRYAQDDNREKDKDVVSCNYLCAVII
jgi:hypothetical protein